MAIGFCRLEFVKRSKGKNMITKSAYNGKLRLEFDGNCVASRSIYDWTGPGRGEKPISHSILLPDHVNEKYRDPEILWNACEQFEKRKDSQVGKDMLFALPGDKIISNEQRIEIAQGFAKEHFVSKGYGVQVDVHPPGKRKSYESTDLNEEEEVNETNFHAHYLITPRSFSEDGETFSSKKVNDLVPEIRGSSHFAFGGLEWNKLATQYQNQYFEKHGIDLRVDQPGITPQLHLGPVRMRGRNSSKILEVNDKIEELGQLLAQDPDTILQKLLENKSIFLKSDLEIFLQKNVPESEIAQVRESFWKHPQLMQLFDKESLQPTVKFSSLVVIEEERKILRLADRIHEKPTFSIKYESIPSSLNNEQSIAFEKVTKGKSLACIEGLAGTGKSHLLAALKECYESNGYRVRAFGPDNATAKVLQEKGFTDATNIHKFLNKNYFSKKNLISQGKEVWIIDESSKVANRPLLELLKSAELNSIQVIFSGNSAQLSSVERGGMFKHLCESYGYAFLGEIQRQKSLLDRDISKRLAHGDVASAVDMIASSGGFIWNKTKEDTILCAVEKWAKDSMHFPCSSSIIIANTNKEVRQINDLVHAIRMARGEVVNKEFDCHTIFGNIRVSEGDIIEFRANDKKLNVMNGDRGVLVKTSETEFIVALENKKVSFNPQKFISFQLAYATTNYRSQGGTFDNVYIVYNRYMNQQLFYVARTRHRSKAHCFVSSNDAKNLMQLKSQVVRSEEIQNTLTYTTAAEIDLLRKNQQRKQSIQELCESDSLMSRSQGYGSRAWDYLKSGVAVLVEEISDVRSDKSFYSAHHQNNIGQGRVVEVKEEKINGNRLIDKKEKDKEIQSTELSRSPRSSAFQQLEDNKKVLYKNYFDKCEKASALYAIVQSEASAFAVSKETTKSFSDWQKSCVDRNQAAFELLRSSNSHKAVIGQKGLEILQDRSQRHEQYIKPRESIEPQIQENIDSILYRLFPEGPQRRDSRGFRFGSKGSLLVTCVGEKKGCYYNFETNEGGHILQLIEKKLNLTRAEAVSWTREFLKESGGKPAPSHFSTAKFAKAREENWTSMQPPSNASIPKLDSLSRYLDINYRLSAAYPYRDTAGNLMFYTLRLESKADGKKIVLPLSYGKIHPADEPSWKLKAYDNRNEILYNSHLLHQQPYKPILIVEGEKTADAASKLLGKDYVVVSWSGGAAAAKDANWKLLSGREIIVWPDNDPAGFKASSDICRSLREAGVQSLKVVSKETLSDIPQKWDLADTLPTGKSPNFITDCLLRAESKAISMDRLTNIAAQHGLTFKQLNEVVCNVDDRLRGELEKTHGSKTWEIDASILSETNKTIKERFLQPMTKIASQEKTVQNERDNNKSLGMTPSEL